MRSGESGGSVDSPARTARDVATDAPPDLATLAASYRREVTGARAWALPLVGIGGLALGASLVTLAGNRQWPAWTLPASFALGWAILLAAFGLSTVRTRRASARHVFRCPSCGDELLGGRAGVRSLGRAELALAAGQCPSCRATLDGAPNLSPD